VAGGRRSSEKKRSVGSEPDADLGQGAERYREEFVMTWKPEVDELNHRHAMADRMGGPEGVERQHRQGKLTIRSADLLVDPLL
jgi:hypothetical protein